MTESVISTLLLFINIAKSITTQWAKPLKKQSVRSVFLTIWHCTLSAALTKNALLETVFWRFCALGSSGILEE